MTTESTFVTIRSSFAKYAYTKTALHNNIVLACAYYSTCSITTVVLLINSTLFMVVGKLGDPQSYNLSAALPHVLVHLYLVEMTVNNI